MNNLESLNKTVIEYIWIGGKGEIRSKTRVFHNFLPFGIKFIPDWNYDGSSTWQADSNGDTEIILKPCVIYKDALREIPEAVCYIVLCDTYDSNDNPVPTNHRYFANNVFNQGSHLKPWFGLEQEYFMVMNDKKIENDNGYHYCGIAYNNIERQIAEEHMNACIKTGLSISGINSEVSKYQWEFQIGPCEGITSGDQVIVAKYLLERIAKKYNVGINYHPKPDKTINGSGCHINFSTIRTRLMMV
jgi:glutamine synthetase